MGQVTTILTTIGGLIFAGAKRWKSRKEKTLQEKIANLTQIEVNAENIDEVIKKARTSIFKLEKEISREKDNLKKLSDSKPLFQIFDTDGMKSKKEELKRLREQLNKQKDLLSALDEAKKFYIDESKGLFQGVLITVGAIILIFVVLNGLWLLLIYNFLLQPALFLSPSFIETGVSLDSNVSKSLTLENQGLAKLTDVTIQLLNTDGSSAPPWIYLTTATELGTLSFREKHTLSLEISPPTSASKGDYHFILRVTSSNHATTDINIFVAVTQSGVGNILFKVENYQLISK